MSSGIGSTWRGDAALSALAAALAPGRLLVTGGAVRDSLLDGHPDDFDAVATVAAEDGRDALDAAGLVRERHPFMPDVDFVTLRGRWVRDVSLSYLGSRDGLEGDARRRDFTCNAIYLSLDGDIHDPLGGLADLEARILRPAAADAFERDPIRILRAPRMLRRLGPGREAEGLREAMAAAAPLLAGCPPIRVIRELAKLLDLTGADEAIADIGLLETVGALGVIYPDADPAGFAAYCRGCEALGLEEGDESFPRIGVLGRRPGRGYDGRVAAWGDRRDGQIGECADCVETGSCESPLMPPGRQEALFTHFQRIHVGAEGTEGTRG